MKKALLTILLGVASITAMADTTTPSMTPEQAKSQWQSMTPEQQAAAKSYMQTQAQGKQDAWNAMTPEEQQAKKDAAKSTAEPYATQGKTQMQERMSGSGMSGMAGNSGMAGMHGQMQGRMAGRGR